MEQKQIDWLVGPDGAVVKYEAKLVRRETRELRLRSSGDLHARARIGLIYVHEVLKKCGWHCNCVEQSSTALSLELDKVSVDVSIRKPTRIAYVTSRPDWEYRREVIGKTPDIEDPFTVKVQKGQEIVRPTAQVTLASDLIKDPWVVQVITTKTGGDSTVPVYIPVTRDSGDPAINVAKCVLLTIRNILGNDKFKLETVAHELNALDASPVLILPE